MLKFKALSIEKAEERLLARSWILSWEEFKTINRNGVTYFVTLSEKVDGHTLPVLVEQAR